MYLSPCGTQFGKSYGNYSCEFCDAFKTEHTFSVKIDRSAKVN